MTATPPWHERFFAGAWRHAQPDSFSAEDSRECAESLRELLQLEAGSRILDVPCGDGRIASHFAQWGYEVCGIDRSQHFLDVARARPSGENVEYLRKDMWRDDFGEACFDAALSIWSSIGYAETEDDRHYFASIRRALRAGGTLVVDTQCLETLLTDFQERQWYRAGPLVVAEERRYDPTTARVESHWIFAGPEVYEECESSLRIYTVHELQSLLGELGFDQFESYGSMELEEFSVESSRLVLVARLPHG